MLDIGLFVVARLENCFVTFVLNNEYLHYYFGIRFTLNVIILNF